MILPVFTKFTREAAIIGRLLAGYAELEIELLLCVSVVRNDFDATLKAMFRTRGERRRIDVADALGRQLYTKLDLGLDFERAITAIGYCLKVRNRYAHSNWYDDNSGQLTFVNVEEIAKRNEFISGLDGLTRYYVDVSTLEEQERYFAYTVALLRYLNFEGRLRAGTLDRFEHERPGELKRPPLQASKAAER